MASGRDRSSPLRRAAIWLSQRNSRWTVGALAVLAGVEVSRASAFLTRMQASRAIDLDDGTATRAAGWDQWSRPSRSNGGRSGGHSRRYLLVDRLVADVMDCDCPAELCGRQSAAVGDDNVDVQAGAVGISPGSVQLMRYGLVPLTKPELSRLLAELKGC